MILIAGAALCLSVDALRRAHDRRDDEALGDALLELGVIAACAVVLCRVALLLAQSFGGAAACAQGWSG